MTIKHGVKYCTNLTFGVITLIPRNKQPFTFSYFIKRFFKEHLKTLAKTSRLRARQNHTISVTG